MLIRGKRRTVSTVHAATRTGVGRFVGYGLDSSDEVLERTRAIETWRGDLLLARQQFKVDKEVEVIPPLQGDGV